MALQWTDVDLTNGLLRVRGTLARVDGELLVTDTKTAKSRGTIPRAAPAVATLRALKVRQATESLRAGNQWTQTGYVFTTELGASGATPATRSGRSPSRLRRAQLEHVGLHTLRHSAASVMLSNGVPVPRPVSCGGGWSPGRCRHGEARFWSRSGLPPWPTPRAGTGPRMPVRQHP